MVISTWWLVSFGGGHLALRTLDIRVFGATDIRHYQNSTETQETHWTFENIALDNVQKCRLLIQNITSAFEKLEHGHHTLTNMASLALDI